MKATPEQNKKLVLDAFDILFNKRDYAAAARQDRRGKHIPLGFLRRVKQIECLRDELCAWLQPDKLFG